MTLRRTQYHTWNTGEVPQGWEPTEQDAGAGLAWGKATSHRGASSSPSRLFEVQHDNHSQQLITTVTYTYLHIRVKRANNHTSPAPQSAAGSPQDKAQPLTSTGPQQSPCHAHSGSPGLTALKSSPCTSKTTAPASSPLAARFCPSTPTHHLRNKTTTTHRGENFKSHRMAWVGEDLKDHLVSTPVLWAGCPSPDQAVQGLSAWPSMHPRMGHPQLLGQQWQGLSTSE